MKTTRENSLRFVPTNVDPLIVVVPQPQEEKDILRLINPITIGSYVHAKSTNTTDEKYDWI